MPAAGQYAARPAGSQPTYGSHTEPWPDVLFVWGQRPHSTCLPNWQRTSPSTSQQPTTKQLGRSKSLYTRHPEPNTQDRQEVPKCQPSIVRSHTVEGMGNGSSVVLTREEVFDRAVASSPEVVVSICGKETPFILDTGSEVTVLPSTLFHQLASYTPVHQDVRLSLIHI